MKRPLAIKRRLLLTVAAYAGGIALAGALPGHIIVCCTAAVAAALVTAFCRIIRPAMCALLCGALLAGLFYVGAEQRPMEKLDLSGVTCRGRVVRVISDSAMLVDGLTANGISTGARALVYCQSAAEALPGQRVELAGCTLRSPARAKMPYGFDQARYLSTIRADYVVRADKADLSGKASAIMGTAMLARRRLAQAADAVFLDNADLVKAVVLGESDYISDGLEADFAASGVSHLLAVSGLHMGMVYALLMLLTRPLPIGVNVKRALVCVLVIAYCFVTGLSPSAVRAAVMICAVQAGKALGRQQDGLTSLALAAGVILAINPMTLYSTGFQLSVASVGGIMLLAPALEVRLAFLGRPLASSVAVTLAAQAGVLPLLAWHFGSVSAVSVVANIVMVPLMFVVVALSIPALLLGLLLPPAVVGAAFSFAYWASAAEKLIAGFCAGLPYASVNVCAPWLVTCVLYYTALFALAGGRGLVRARAWLAFAAVAIYLVQPLAAASPALTWTVYDVGNADCSLISCGGATVLVDCARPGSGAAESMRAQGISVDTVVLTHADSDHAGGLQDVLSCVKVNRVALWEGTDLTALPEDTAAGLLYAAEHGVEIVWLSAGDRLVQGAITLDVLGPVAASGKTNEDSLILMASAPEGSILLMGDADMKAESAVLCTGAHLGADAIKVGHHGSAYSTGEPLLAAACPELAVISVGRNGYGHPTQAALDRLDRAGALIYTTMASSTLRVDFARGVSIRAFDGGHGWTEAISVN